MEQYAEVYRRYLEVWNERDAARRIELLQTSWAETAQYSDPMAQVTGLNAINELIQGVQAQFPGFRFSQHGSADGHQNYLRFAWELGPGTDGPAPIAGSDTIILTNDGRIERVIGFLDRVPAAAE